MPMCEHLDIDTLESTCFSVEMWSLKYILKMELLKNLCRTVEHNLKNQDCSGGRISKSPKVPDFYLSSATC